MNTLIKTLSALALTATLTGAAFAGPSNPASSFTGNIAPRTASGCPMIKAETTLVANANPKVHAPIQKVVGYRHEGCKDANLASMTCGTAGASCAAMRKS